MVKLSQHSKIRLKERTDLNRYQRKRFFKQALNYGKSPGELKDGDLKKYLTRKTKIAKVKLYNGYVFVYSKNNKTLYTMYKLPDILRSDKE